MAAFHSARFRALFMAKYWPFWRTSPWPANRMAKTPWSVRTTGPCTERTTSRRTVSNVPSAFFAFSSTQRLSNRFQAPSNRYWSRSAGLTVS